MSSKAKFKNYCKVNNECIKGKKRSLCIENSEGKNVDEKLVLSVKKLEPSSKVIDMNEEIQKARSFSNSPSKEKYAGSIDDQILSTNIASSPIITNFQKRKKLSYDEDDSKNNKKRQFSSSFKKIRIPEQSPNLNGKKSSKFASESQDSNEEKLTVLSKCKTSQFKGLKFSNEKRKDSLSSTLHKDGDQLSNRLKIPIDLKKRAKKFSRPLKKVDEGQRPISQLPRNSNANSVNKLQEPIKRQIKPKTIEKLKFNSNRSKPKLSAKVLNSKSKLPSEESEKVLTGILKVKKARFETYRQNSYAKEILESKNTDSKSSLSLSESAEWVNLEIKQFVAEPSEFVGDFLKKLNDDKKIFYSKVNSEESKKSSYFEQPSGSSCYDSVYFVSDELPIVSEKKHKNVPPLQLTLLHNKKTSDSSRYCEQDAGIMDSKDSILKSMNSIESKFSGNRSARQVIRSKKLPSK